MSGLGGVFFSHLSKSDVSGSPLGSENFECDFINETGVGN